MAATSEHLVALRPRVQSAARAVAILLAVADSESGLTTKQISDRLGIGRQTVYHLIHTLVESGVLNRSSDSHYVLGLRVGTLAHGLACQLAPGEHLAAVVRALAEETGESAYAAGWWADEIMTLAFARGTSPVQAEAPHGYVGQGHARASGKLLLALAPPALRENYLERHPLVRVGPRTLTDRAALDAELMRIVALGYATDDEEFAAGLCCLAVPVGSGHPSVVLGLSAPHDRYIRRREDYLACMRRLARAPMERS